MIKVAGSLIEQPDTPISNSSSYSTPHREDYSTTDRVELRFDVREFLDNVPDLSQLDNPWHEYTELKKELSALCGWDAPKYLFDQTLYEQAFAVMTRKMGI